MAKSQFIATRAPAYAYLTTADLLLVFPVSFAEWITTWAVGSIRTHEPKGSFARLPLKWGRDMSERKITQLFGLILGVLFACTLVLNVFAF